MVKTAKRGDTSRTKNKVNVTADRAKSGHTKKAQNPKNNTASSDLASPHIISKNTNPFYGSKPTSSRAHRVPDKRELHLKDLFSKINQEKDKLQLLTSQSKSKSSARPPSRPKKSIFNSYNTNTNPLTKNSPHPTSKPKNRRKNTKQMSTASLVTEIGSNIEKKLRSALNATTKTQYITKAGHEDKVDHLEREVIC